MTDSNLDKILENAQKDLKDKSELGEVMDNLDSDVVSNDTKMSSVDFNTRLDGFEISTIMVIDELTRMGIFPDRAGLTRQKKRLSVSLQGKGREEKVRIIQGERDNRTGMGVMDRVGSMFQRKP